MYTVIDCIDNFKTVLLYLLLYCIEWLTHYTTQVSKIILAFIYITYKNKEQ